MDGSKHAALDLKISLEQRASMGRPLYTLPFSLDTVLSTQLACLS